MSGEKNNMDRRKSIRHNIMLHLHLVFQDLEELREAYSKDISEGGVFIETNKPLPEGAQMKLKISLVHEDISYIDTTGEVVHVTKPGEDRHPGMGIKFIDISEHDRRFIKDYLEQKVGGKK